MFAWTILFLSAFAVDIVVVNAVPDDELKPSTESVESIKKKLKEKKAILVDVREKSEWDEGHVKGAKLIPWSKLRFASKRKKLKELPDDELTVYCYCKSGFRSMNAAKKLKEIGYKVVSLKAGYKDLVKGGFESEK